MTIDEQKKQLRKIIKQRKTELSEEIKELKSQKIFNAIEKLDEFINAKTVLMYWSLPDEVNTHNAVLTYSKYKKVLLPVVNNDILELRLFNGINNMKPTKPFGILEPVGENFDRLNEVDLVIVPGLAFDSFNNRMGRGKAYYDKLLLNIKAILIGVCFDIQYLEQIPADKNDIPMHRVIYA